MIIGSYWKVRSSSHTHSAAGILSSRLPRIRSNTDGAGIQFLGTSNAGLAGSDEKSKYIFSYCTLHVPINYSCHIEVHVVLRRNFPGTHNTLVGAHD